MDLKAAEESVLAWHAGGPAMPLEAALWLLERVQELESESQIRKMHHNNIERRLDDEIKALRGAVEKVRRNRPQSDSIELNEHALAVLQRVKEGWGYELYTPMDC